MRTNRCFWTSLLLLVATTTIVADDEVAIRKSTPMKNAGGLGTRGYSPLEDEVPFMQRITEKSIDLWAHIKLPKAANMSDEEWRKLQERNAKRKQNLIPVDQYELHKQTGQNVGWFGIVRSMEYDADADRTRILAEHKYFDGLTDLHLQVVSIYGAGDFRVDVPGKITAEQIPNLSLIRVYGVVANDPPGTATIDAKYVRVWDWGLFTFMDYGKDKSNPKWLGLRKVSGEDAYRSRVDRQFYEERLGPRKE